LVLAHVTSDVGIVGRPTCAFRNPLEAQLLASNLEIFNAQLFLQVLRHGFFTMYAMNASGSPPIEKHSSELLSYTEYQRACVLPRTCFHIAMRREYKVMGICCRTRGLHVQGRSSPAGILSILRSSRQKRIRVPMSAHARLSVARPTSARRRC